MVLLHGNEGEWTKRKVFQPFLAMTQAQAQRVASEFKADNKVCSIPFDEWIAESFPKFWKTYVGGNGTQRWVPKIQPPPMSQMFLATKPLVSLGPKPLVALDLAPNPKPLGPNSITPTPCVKKFNVESVLCRTAEIVILCNTWSIHTTTGYLRDKSVLIPSNYFDCKYGHGNVSQIETRARCGPWSEIPQPNVLGVMIPKEEDESVLRVWVIDPNRIPPSSLLRTLHPSSSLASQIASAAAAAESAKRTAV